MDLTDDPTCIIGCSCRLPGDIVRPDGLFEVFQSGNWQTASTSAPQSRGFELFDGVRGASDSSFGRGGWLSEAGVEQFDPNFFRIPASEVDGLRPNVRLALELTWEALEHAGIPPSTLRGRNVAISFGVGTEDGWDMQRLKKEDGVAFDENWAASSDPSGVSGRVSHFFGFRGTSTTIATACASGGFALREGIVSLYHEDAEIAIIGSMATHFNPSPFAWAAASGVASQSGRCSSFSPYADGYSPSEGAVVFVLRRLKSALQAGDVIHAQIRSLASAHNGATRTMFTPSAMAQTELLRRAQLAAKVCADNIDLCEAHGTGTQVGDALEAEALRSVFGSRTGGPLLLSSAKTILGHCHGSAVLVGILKVLSCFERRAVPPHGVQPAREFMNGPIVIPTANTPINSAHVLAQVSAAGFTGSIVSLVLETGPLVEHSPSENLKSCAYLLPFSHQSPAQLEGQIKAVMSWAAQTHCPLYQLATILGICREHHPYRKAFIACTLDSFVRADDVAMLTGPVDSRLSKLAEVSTGAHDISGTGGIDRLADLCRLYERGGIIPFATVYDKKTIDPNMLTSFPFYRFNRRRCWKDAHVSSPDPQIHPTPPRNVSISRPAPPPPRQSAEEDQLFNDLIDQYGASFPQHVQYTHKSALSVTSRSCILLTGANGMLGSRLLNLLLRLPNLTICCPIRGDGWARLQAVFTTYDLDTERLQTGYERGAVRILSTQDICAPQLGLASQDWTWLCRHLDQIVHLAWAVNFNLPLSEFRGLLRCTRNLAELCLVTLKRVRYFFIGTHASTFGYEGDYVPERILPPRRADAVQQGYAVAKLIAEHALLKIAKSTGYALDLSIVRVGQICGDTASGAWSMDEMMPMFIASLPILRVLPESSPPVAWIPSDTCAAVLCDFLLGIRNRSHEPTILHVANPAVLSWSDVAHDIARIARVADFKLVPMREFIQCIRVHLATSNTNIAIARLLPFLDSIADKAAQQRFTPLEVAASRRLSRALHSCPPIRGSLLTTIVNRSLRSLENANGRPHTGHIFVFGPAMGSIDAVSPRSGTVTRIMEIATSKAFLQHGELDADPLLERQLYTIAMQMDSVDDMRSRGVVPTIATGYCFGEYAAAIVSGILTLESAVQLLVQRGRAVRGVVGALLNVFADLATVNCALSPLLHPPSIAIIAGPTHVVLSGSADDVRIAQDALNDFKTGIKTILVPAQIPFHSSLMAAPARAFDVHKLPPPVKEGVCFVSGVAGIVLPPERVTTSYWKRHMCTRVDFHHAMRTARELAPGAQIVDVGPGEMIGRMLARYGDEWETTSIVGPRDAAQILLQTQRTAPVPAVADTTIPSLSSARPERESKDPKEVTLALLTDMLGYEASPSLLSRSLHALGIHSLDFVRFSESLSARTGIQVTMSAYVSDMPLGKILESDGSAV